MKGQEYIYKVSFHVAPDSNGERDFYFGSLAAIYETFTKEQIGCAANRLYTTKVSDGNIYTNKRCTIQQYPIYRKSKAPARKEDAK